ncbi:MAG: hypothetical protein UW37_C0039G0005 [Candidatus Gottesmanbacteria bacterium GW2011_GWA2_44_17]|uniref:Uncharacterized protein n=2 Tax=Candidatus Gottesmaniibacteriota TaxID=1752720 RepID=A0A0G1HH24_9BACT|nr:MAG: hypothetical protein UV63_C0029G0006 [Microgenomates group bacterium GW2011_GWC1_43_11]KKT35445.1 MAG: hypothetical protein UW22_C0053G0005 [Candidatus Gottesmanbacteria bacterium GW2011_GWB1_44_11c]KKT45838.1 MAG: hypothetical protein UW37_C0039G0005 [Candidatus Gottesmanbacteria bacterium GW2011_GWA2_44_17]HCM82135.1 hypothetical protein [Patescibacteria group bacterium]
MKKSYSSILLLTGSVLVLIFFSVCVARNGNYQKNAAERRSDALGGGKKGHPHCFPRPACIDGIEDPVTGDMMYCDPMPGVIYCPETPTPTPKFYHHYTSSNIRS